MDEGRGQRAWTHTAVEAAVKEVVASRGWGQERKHQGCNGGAERGATGHGLVDRKEAANETNAACLLVMNSNVAPKFL